MSPKQRFQMFLEPEQVEALKRIEARTGARMAAQIRLALDEWLKKEDRPRRTDRPRASTRRRS
jgi:hypothetical protein